MTFPSRVSRVVQTCLVAFVTALVLWFAEAPARADAPARGDASSQEASEEAPDSPRASVAAFLDLADRSRYAEAARYLDVPRGADGRSAELARKLSAVLNERLPIDPNKLSPESGGQKDDKLPAGTDELGRLKSPSGRFVSVRIVRHEARSPEDEARWVFSQSTVQSVDALYAGLNGRWVREHLPERLLGQGWWGLYYWQWLAFPVLALVCGALAYLLTGLASIVVRRAVAHWSWGTTFVRRLKVPVIVGGALLLFWALIPKLALTLRAEDIVGRILRALGYLTGFWMLLRGVAVAGDELSSAPWAASRPSLRSLSSFGVKIGKFIVAALALMVALSELGYPVTSVVAGLGLGGVALALAAQKTVENLFGSISILADQPFLIGDVIRVDGIEGTVERIGVRSTRLRTADRTVVIMPNGKLADMRIESLGPRDRVRFATKLVLDRATSTAQVERVMAGLKSALEAHAKVVGTTIWVHLLSLGDADGGGLVVDVAALVGTRDFTEFAGVRDELLLAFAKVVEDEGATFARPIRHLVVAPGHVLTTPESAAKPTP